MRIATLSAALLLALAVGCQPEKETAVKPNAADLENLFEAAHMQRTAKISVIQDVLKTTQSIADSTGDNTEESKAKIAKYKDEIRAIRIAWLA